MTSDTSVTKIDPENVLRVAFAPLFPISLRAKKAALKKRGH